jgi:polysaccharide pyruvyl transferase WcaK-like protein
LDRIIVRDAASSRWLEGVNVPHRLGGDIAGLLSRTSPKGADPQSRVVIAPCGTAGAHGEAYEDGVVSAARTLRAARRDVAFTVVALNSHSVHGDRAVSEQLARRLRTEGLVVETRAYAQLGVQGVIDLISASTAVIATRLHAGIVAYLADVPTLLVAYHRKNVDFADDIGLPSTQLLNVGDEATRWTSGAESLQSSKPLMPSDAYRARAVEAYFAERNRA